MIPKRLEIWWVDLDPALGAETQKLRPCVVLSGNTHNRLCQTVWVAPLLRQGRKPFHFAVNITPTAENGLDQPRMIDMRGVRSVDKIRLKGRQGSIESQYLPRIRRAILAVCGFFEP